jgi:U3 small nucleolar RNA-associated protein 23
MKHGRAKAARKTLKFYSLNANIKPPFKVILDGNFLAAAMKYKIPLFERIAQILQTNEIYFFVTRSALVELDTLPKDDIIYTDARQFGLDECEIIERSDTITKKSNGTTNVESTPSQDIINLVANGNKNKYFVATQDKALSDSLRDMVNVPQLWLTKGVLIFDTPSAVSRKASQLEEREKQKTGGGTMTKDESELIRRLREEKRKERLNDESATNKGTDERRKRKARGPNPLSCKKKKTNDNNEKQGNFGSSGKKRRRRRKSTNNNDEA